MVEFAVVLCIQQTKDTKMNEVVTRGPLFKNNVNASKDGNLNSNKGLYEQSIRKTKRYSTTQKIDLAALLLFTLFYILFNIVYFSYYMQLSKKFSQV